MLLSKRTKDITGNTYGSLTALAPTHKSKNTIYWDFRCVCGKIHNARGNTVVYESTNSTTPNLPSCGCVELANKTKHGFRKAKDTHPAYKAYCAMMTRCYDKNNEGYQWYGAKGVTVCDGWKDNPKAFVEWAISNGWKPGLHIDKDIICEEKGIYPHIYSPETCQWVSPKINVSAATNRNNYGKHPNVRLSHQQVAEIEELYFSGKITNKSELARMFGLKSPSSVNRLIRLAKESDCKVGSNDTN